MNPSARYPVAIAQKATHMILTQHKHTIKRKGPSKKEGKEGELETKEAAARRRGKGNNIIKKTPPATTQRSQTHKHASFLNFFRQPPDSYGRVARDSNLVVDVGSTRNPG